MKIFSLDESFELGIWIINVNDGFPKFYEDTAVFKGAGRCFMEITNLNVIEGLKDEIFFSYFGTLPESFNETQFAKGKGSGTFESWTLQSVWNCSWRIKRSITAVLVSEKLYI